MNSISKHPPMEMYADGVEIDCQCARCGSSVDLVDCVDCEDGYDGHDCGEDCCACIYPEENVPCQMCDCEGHWHQCISSEEWCQENPIPGRENMRRGEIEWFTIPGNHRQEKS